MEAILIPVKRLSESKLRLAGVLGPPQRRRLALSMLADVLLAAAGWPLRMVVTSDPDVASIAESAGWSIVSDPGSGLNDAVAEGTSVSIWAGATALLVLPFDVPLVTVRELEALFATDADVVVARSDDGGTSGLLRRPPGAITARFGPDSARSHALPMLCDEALKKLRDILIARYTIGQRRCILRQHTAIRRRQQQIDDFLANAGIAARQRVCTRQHDRAGFRSGKKRALPDGQMMKQVDLVLRQFFVRDAKAAQRAEAGVDAVDGARLRRE